ncbi:O-antigen polysaccharide polymerase Wzy [Devosia psychrophila]|uniref:O-antigen polysaccharide polymerase Wzy n=1 Tax=Devosia psychrophila TaxID=728005 RepID=A0A0F5PSM5_9HYPH|nr:O-antigen polysaccharide polymerase Wzy [Devosia psychrophila]KKC31585.1 hypothetical protein WH91_18625 [Devosia psychrophila]SFD47170.1 O-antigen polysaccharide polymerase Wzy [Devosia psychrophila]
MGAYFQTRFFAADLSLDDAEAIASWQFIAAIAAMVATAYWLHKTLIQPYILFLMTTTLFIGGRLVSYVLGYRGDPVFAMANQTVDIASATAAGAVALMSTVMPAILSIHSGYLLFWAFRAEARDLSAPTPSTLQRSLCWPAVTLLLVAFPLAVYGIVQQLVASRIDGYMAAYAQTSEFGTRWGTIGQYGLIISLGLAFAAGNRTIQWLCIIALGMVSAVAFLIGIRSSFIAFVILFAWFIHKRVWRIPTWAAVMLPVVCVVLAQAALAFSSRTDTAVSQEVADSAEARVEFFLESIQPNAALWFARSQGSTLLYFPLALDAAPYPWPAFVQTFLPGFGAVSSMAGARRPLSDLYFAQHMAKQTIPDGYAKGEGLGWSIIMDFIVFGFSNPLAIVLIGAGFGFAFAMLIWLSGVNAIWFGALAMLLPKIVLLPRAGLYSIFPYLFAFLAIVAGWWVLSRLVRKGDLSRGPKKVIRAT